ncbi:hypothetical protein FJ366_03560 [Candidatus Dependentiae bacterium]|nr:hypothetical protein [Candidatus Dependentiae bacterium]
MSTSTSKSTSNNLITIQILTEAGEQTINALWIEISSPNGFFSVGKGHIPTISLLKIGGILTYSKIEGTVETLAVPGGMAIIQNDLVKLILYKPISEY